MSVSGGGWSGFWFLAVSVKEMIIILLTLTSLINLIRENSDTKSGLVDIDFFFFKALIMPWLA